MPQRIPMLALLLTVFAPTLATAEQVRFRFVPADAPGSMKQVPIGPEKSLGELKRGVGLRTFPYPHAVQPTQMVTFRHPFNGRHVTVPLRLPADPPQMVHTRDRIIYNYGDYTVEARFLPDGAVDVIYNSGLLWPLPF